MASASAYTCFTVATGRSTLAAVSAPLIRHGLRLIVICGPRISQDVAGVLATDPVLRFERLPAGWAVRDLASGHVYASGQDQTPASSSDVAYLSRLHRPDGDGTVIV